MLMAESGKSVLLVDDDLALREMYSERLKAEGFVVEMAQDGEEALKKAGDVNPNIILLDIMMPKLNGLDVLKRLKENEATKAIPVIVLTALIQDREKFEGMTRGAADYLVKSETMPGEVVSKINRVLAGETNPATADNAQSATSPSAPETN